MLHKESFFTISVRFFYKKSSGLFLLVRDVFNQVCDVTFEILADSVKIIYVQTLGNFIVDFADCRWSYAGLTGKLCLSHALFSEYSGQMNLYHIVTAFVYNIVYIVIIQLKSESVTKAL